MAQQPEYLAAISHLVRGEEEAQRAPFAIAEHVQLGVQATLRALDHPRTIPFSEASCSAVRLHEGAVDYQSISPPA